ncbi:unnamed protein product [Penicillium viridicatum]
MDGFTDEERKLARSIKALSHWCDADYEKQLRKGQLEVTNLWNKTDGDGDKIEQTKGQRGGASHWKLMALPPEQDLFDAAGNVKWQPKYVRLTDDAAIMSLCIHDKVHRATYLPMKIDWPRPPRVPNRLAREVEELLERWGVATQKAPLLRNIKQGTQYSKFKDN